MDSKVPLASLRAVLEVNKQDLFIFVYLVCEIEVQTAIKNENVVIITKINF